MFLSIRLSGETSNWLQIMAVQTGLGETLCACTKCGKVALGSHESAVLSIFAL